MTACGMTVLQVQARPTPFVWEGATSSAPPVLTGGNTLVTEDGAFLQTEDGAFLKAD